jgi:hypothetical protein
MSAFGGKGDKPHLAKYPLMTQSVPSPGRSIRAARYPGENARRAKHGGQ